MTKPNNEPPKNDPGKTIEARGLASVSVDPALDREDAAVLILRDTADERTGYIINADGLNALLVPLLGLATKWADQADLKVETLIGPRSALPAQRMSIEQGRDAKECAVRVFVGKVEITFLIPLDEVLAASADLVRQLDPSADIDDNAITH